MKRLFKSVLLSTFPFFVYSETLVMDIFTSVDVF